METNHHSITANSASSRVEAILCMLFERGFRRTPALRSLIREMVLHPLPASLAHWSSLDSLSELNPVTLYRMMMRLEQAGVVRRVYLGERAQCFQLIQSGHQPDYLVCTNCGELQPVEAPAALRQLEQQLVAQSGWHAVRHELEFFGLCPDCTKNSGEQRSRGTR